MDRKQQAKNVDMYSFLWGHGHECVKKSPTKAWYNSPFRNENVPSFVIDLKLNRWSDYGINEHGDILDFVMKFESCSFPEAIDKIIGGDITSKKHNPDSIPSVKTGIGILDVKEIQNKYLMAYSRSRAIDPDLMKLHCKEVDFVFCDWDHVIHTAIGFQNDKGGFELRSPSKKVGNSPKYWSTRRGASDSSHANVFEGFFDYLSHLQWNKYNYPKSDSYILNGLAFCSWVKKDLEMYDEVGIYLDNGFAADEAIADNFSDDKYIIKRDLYKDHGDYNEFVKFKLLENE